MSTNIKMIKLTTRVLIAVGTVVFQMRSRSQYSALTQSFVKPRDALCSLSMHVLVADDEWSLTSN